MKKQVAKSSKSKTQFKKSSKFSIRKLYANHRNLVIIGAILLLAGGGYVGYRTFAYTLLTKTVTAADAELKGGRVVYGAQNITDQQSGLANKTVRAVYLGSNKEDIISFDEQFDKGISGNSFYDCWYIRVVANPKLLGISAVIKVDSSDGSNTGWSEIKLGSIWPDSFGYRTVCGQSREIHATGTQTYTHSISFKADGVATYLPQDAIIYIAKITRQSRVGGSSITGISNFVNPANSPAQITSKKVTIRPRSNNTIKGYWQGVSDSIYDDKDSVTNIEIGLGYGPDNANNKFLPNEKHAYIKFYRSDVAANVTEGVGFTKQTSQAPYSYLTYVYSSYTWQPNIDYSFEQKQLTSFQNKSGKWIQVSLKNESTGETKVMATYDGGTGLSAFSTINTTRFDDNWGFQSCDYYPYAATEYKNFKNNDVAVSTSDIHADSVYNGPKAQLSLCVATRRVSIVPNGVFHETGRIVTNIDKTPPVIDSVSKPQVSSATTGGTSPTSTTKVAFDITVHDESGILGVWCTMKPIVENSADRANSVANNCRFTSPGFSKTATSPILGFHNARSSTGSFSVALPEGCYDLEIRILDTSFNEIVKTIHIMAP